MSWRNASTPSKTWMGIDLWLTASSKVTPEPGGSGEIARPTVARNGTGRRPAAGDRLDGRAGALRSLDAHRCRRSELDVEAVVTLQRLGDDLLLDLAVERQEQLLAGVVLAQVDERILFGQLGQRVEHRPLLLHGRAGRSPSPGWVGRRRLVDTAGRSGRTCHRCGPSRARGPWRSRRHGSRARGCVVPRSKTSIAVTVSTSSPSWTRSRVRSVPANMRTKAIFSPVGPRSILNTVPDAGPGAVAVAGGQQLRDRVQQVVDADAGQRGAEVHRQRRAAAPSGRRAPREVDRERSYARRGSDAGSRRRCWRAARWRPSAKTGSSRPCRLGSWRRSVPTPDGVPIARTSMARRSATAASTRSVVGADPVDLVHEHDRRHAEPAQGAEEQQGLRLHALDGRDDQDGAIEDAEHALDLGDEVRVPRRVDEVDRHAVDHERRRRPT